MSSATLKNYYAILGVSRSATADEIKGAFRAAAKKHHPDIAPDNPFADAHFKELQEAYEVLFNPAKRARYDEECWLRGLYQRKGRFVISSQWILGEAARLRQHMASVDTYRMNHAALSEYVSALLSDEHLSILQESPQLHGAILDELLPSLQGIAPKYLSGTDRRLMLLAGDNSALQNRVNDWVAARRREARWDRYRPVIVIVFALIICALIWALKRR